MRHHGRRSLVIAGQRVPADRDAGRQHEPVVIERRAAAIAALLRDETPSPPKLINTCYSLVAPDYAISIAGVYHPVNGQLADVEGAGGVSPLEAPPDFRALEASYAEAWFRTITAQTFG